MVLLNPERLCQTHSPVHRGRWGSPRLAFIRLRAAAALLITLPALLTGCSGLRQTRPPVDPVTVSDSDFVHYLAQVSLVTTDEAFRAMLILVDGQDGSKSFEERRDRLVQRDIVNPAWITGPEYVIDRGAVAAMVCRACKLTGGINLVIFGSMGLGDRRYALRELVYREIMTTGADYAPVSGGEFVGILTRADALLAEQGAYETPEIRLESEEEFLANRQAAAASAPARPDAPASTSPAQPIPIR